MALQTPLAKVRHLGSAKEGVNRWWWQRLTAILLVPLSLWFVGSLLSLVAGGADRDDFVDWLSGPVAAVLMLLFLGATFYHLKLGLQVVIEDYVHGRCKWVLLILNTLLCLLLGLAALYSVILIAVQG
jgi:succinate dehydrogenase / fumarate reductase membrane anchor subunit